MNARVSRAAEGMVARVAQRLRKYGTIGRNNATGTPTVNVRGRPGYVYLTLRNGATGAQTAHPARNDVGVALAAGMSVEYRVEGTTHIIVAKSTREDLAVPVPTPPSGVPTHTHDDRYFREDEHLNVSAGAGDAGKPIKLNASGEVDPTMIDLTGVDIGAVIHAAAVETTPLDADETAILDSGASFALKRITWTTIKAFLKTYFDTLYELAGAIATHAALTVTHGVTGAIVGTTSAQTLQNKIVDSTNISTLTSKTTPIDADSAVWVDSASANTFARVTGTNLKAYLKTYFDTLYQAVSTAVLLTTNQSVAGIKTFTDRLAIAATTTTGAALSVIRNLTAASTDSPVVEFTQDHASDDQIVLLVRQDGTALAFKVQGNATSSDMAFKVGSEATEGYFALYTGGIAQLAVNRRITGVFSDTGAAAANINLNGSNGDGNISFYTSPTNNTDPVLAVKFDKNQNVQIGPTAPAGKVHVDQSSTTAAIPVLVLDQADLSEEMIEFVTTVGTGNPIEAVGAKTLTTTHFIRVTIPGVGYRYIPAGTIA